MLIIGHRGAPSISHENTIESFRAAFNHNVDGIEFDVQLTNDHQSIIYHDFELTHNNQKLMINQLSYPDLQNLDLPYHIPTFEEVISICPDDKIINIEIKSNLIHNQTIIANILNILNQYNLFHNIIISSFNPFVLMELNKHTTKVKIGQLWSGSNSQPWFVTYLSYYKLSPYSFHASIEYITPQMAHWVQKKGMKLFLYTVNTPQQLAKAYSLNADAIFSDYPTILDTNSV
tara:strand:- start:3591 stop:4286 length:696 start_codon:yes stop_codon:yes gene_type:complete